MKPIPYQLALVLAFVVLVVSVFVPTAAPWPRGLLNILAAVLGLTGLAFVGLVNDAERAGRTTVLKADPLVIREWGDALQIVAAAILAGWAIAAAVSGIGAS